MGAHAVLAQGRVGVGDRVGAGCTPEARAKQRTALLHLALATDTLHGVRVGYRHVLVGTAYGVAVCWGSWDLIG